MASPALRICVRNGGTNLLLISCFKVSKKEADWTIRGQLIDNIVNRIQAMCKADKEAGELVFGSVTQFIHKRIG